MRSNEEIIIQIKEIIETHVKPGVAEHGGNIEFVSFDNGLLTLELGGACSGCAGSTMTLKMGVENLIKHFVPEVEMIEALDDPFSTVDPFYTDSFMFEQWETIDLQEIEEGPDESDN